MGRHGTTRGRDTAVEELSVAVVSMARAFEPVRPLVRRSRLMSLNARMTAARLGAQGASFAVVAQALGDLAEELSEAVDRAEELLGTQVTLSARAAREQAQLRSFAEAMFDAQLANPDVATALRPDVGLSWERQAAAGGTGGPLWSALVYSREVMVADVRSLGRSTSAMIAALTQLERIAVTRGFFVGSNARIEAARLGGDSAALGHLAADLDELAVEIADQVRSLTAAVRHVAQRCERLVAETRTRTGAGTPATAH